MKMKIKELKEKRFEPVKIELTIETEDELICLHHRINSNDFERYFRDNNYSFNKRNNMRSDVSLIAGELYLKIKEYKLENKL